MSAGRIVGIVIQALVLGTTLLFAIGRLIALESGARVFAYQMF